VKDASDSTSNKLAWLPGAAALLAFVACNGTFVLVGLLSIFGVVLAINPHIQAAMISLFAVLTLVFVFWGFRAHRKLGPIVFAIIGALLIVGTMYISFSKVVESVGLVALIGSAIWNWRLSRNQPHSAVAS
jgi:hypothetical protein